ncbi:putative GPI-anchored protein pfl2 [Amblyraja radiata]|uniref:putative GPI-anchored protein pfl2 n=1 Tax=Amblyraja radiata TaxID=386614 RepID=UPI001403E8AE|nr:putative GPI-anchored protein pfl2 [Amblyraja radiata]
MVVSFSAMEGFMWHSSAILVLIVTGIRPAAVFRVDGPGIHQCCVAPGCPDVGSIPHGSRTLRKDNSVVRYTCDPGFRLSGSPMHYCDGNRWNGTKPVCKELDSVKFEEIHTEITKSNSLPNLNAPLSMKKLSGKLFKVQCCNTGDTAEKGSFVEHIPLPEHHTDTITKTSLALQLLPTEQPAIGEAEPGKNIKGAWNAKVASGNALFNKGSPEDQYNQVNIQHVASISAHLVLPSLTRPSTLSLHSMLVTQLTPLSSPQTKFSTEFLGPEPNSRMNLISSKTPSSASSSLYQPSKLLPQSDLTNLSIQSFPSSSPTQRDTVPSPSLKQSSNIFHTSSVRKYPSSPVPKQWTSKSSLLDKQDASSSQSYSITVVERTTYPAPVALKPYGWLRGTMSGVLKEDGSIDKEDASAASQKQPQKEKISLNIDSQQAGTSGLFTPAVTANGISSKPSASLDEDIVSSLSNSKSLRGKSSQNVTDKYTFTSVSENITAPSSSDTYSRRADQMKVGHATVGLEGTSLPLWSVTVILLPKTGNDHGNSNLPGPVHGQSSISKTTIAILQHAETLPPQTIRHVSDLNATENTGQGNQSNSTNGPEGLINKDRSTTEQRLSLLDAFGKINGSKNSQLTTTTRGAQSNVRQTKSNVRGSTAPESTSPSTPRATVQAQGEQITLNGSLSTNKSSNLTDLMSNVLDAKPTELILQTSLGETSVVGEADVGQVDLPRPIVCPSPVAPDHGRLYFRNLVRRSPWQHKYYIQYSCTPGYALVHGDRFRFCQHNGSWSGERPVCAGKYIQ